MRRLAALSFALIAVLIGFFFSRYSQQNRETRVQSTARRQVIQPANYKPTPSPLSPAILVGDTLYLSGSTGGDPVTGQIVQGGFEPELRQIMSNVQTVLKS